MSNDPEIVDAVIKAIKGGLDSKLDHQKKQRRARRHRFLALQPSVRAAILAYVAEVTSADIEEDSKAER